jgi:hypothetical protein
VALCSRYLKVGPEGFGVLSCSCGWVVSNVNCFRLCAYEQKCRFEALGSILLSDFASLLLDFLLFFLLSVFALF